MRPQHNGRSRLLSPADAALVAEHGASVVECSWARTADVQWGRIGAQCSRVLPYLVAANTVNYGKPGFLPAQRQLKTPWQGFVVAPDVALTPLDPFVTVVDLTSAVPFSAKMIGCHKIVSGNSVPAAGSLGGEYA